MDRHTGTHADVPRGTGRAARPWTALVAFTLALLAGIGSWTVIDSVARFWMHVL